MAFRIDTYAAIDNSVVIAGMASNLQALDINTGAILWSYANPYGKLFEPGPVVVPSGVYTMDETGEVYAFSLPAAAAPAAGRARR
jgi:outer membrane protein assembly factor BamB